MSFASNGKRVIVKSPGDTGRVKQLKERFPNAQFIYIHRDPVEVYHSSVYFWKVIRKEVSFQKISDEMVHEYILQTYRKVIGNYLQEKSIFKENQLIEISFDEMNHSPKETMKKLYSHFQWDSFPEEALQSFISQEKPHKLSKYNTSAELQKELEITWKDVADFS